MINPVIESKIDLNSANFQRNFAASNAQLVQLMELTQAATATAETIQQRQLAMDKLLVRDRINCVRDPASPWLELSTLAGYGLYADHLPHGGLITGIGQVAGRVCVLIANEPCAKGGTYYPITVKKHLRAQQIALQNGLPCIYLVDSGGANLAYQAEVFPDQQHFGRIFYNQAQMSAASIPQVAVVLGSCTAGGAYVPAMADQTIMVKKNATIFLAGPPLVRAATGEKVGAEELGGAELHCRQSGVADYYAETEVEALTLARQIISSLPHRAIAAERTAISLPPRYDCSEIPGLIPQDPREQFPIHEIIARIVDDSRFLEFKPLYGKTLICGMAHLDGYPVGIIANNGILFENSALKGTHFIELCCKNKIPLIFLQNVSGFMVGKQAEAAGITKHGAKMVMAVANARVPKLTVIIGGSFGAGNYAMCGRAYDPNFLWLWPNAKTAVMGGQQAALVLSQLKEMQAQKKNQALDPNELHHYQNAILQQYLEQSSAAYSSARLWDDGVIAPADTRSILIQGLHASLQQPVEETNFGIFRM